MYVHIYVQTHISLYIYVHIHLHIRIYMNICNICNNHEYTMHPTSPEASNPFNSETPTPDLHRTSYKLDIHTLSYIYTILCVYIYTYILEPYKILGRLELPGLGREVEGGILGAPRGLHALKRRTDGRVCVCGCLYYTCPAHIQEHDVPVQTKEEENEERPAQVLHSVPRLNDVSCSCTFKTTRSMPTRPWRSHVRSHRRRTVSLCSSSCMCYNGLRQEKLMPPKPKKRPMEKPAKAKIACMLQHIQNMSCIWQACKKPAEPEGPPPKKKACLWFGRMGGSLHCHACQADMPWIPPPPPAPMSKEGSAWSP